MDAIGTRGYREKGGIDKDKIGEKSVDGRALPHLWHRIVAIIYPAGVPPRAFGGDMLYT
jgi:hypothetical protein